MASKVAQQPAPLGVTSPALAKGGLEARLCRTWRRPHLGHGIGCPGAGPVGGEEEEWTWLTGARSAGSLHLLLGERQRREEGRQVGTPAVSSRVGAGVGHPPPGQGGRWTEGRRGLTAPVLDGHVGWEAGRCLGGGGREPSGPSWARAHTGSRETPEFTEGGGATAPAVASQGGGAGPRGAEGLGSPCRALPTPRPFPAGLDEGGRGEHGLCPSG